MDAIPPPTPPPPLRRRLHASFGILAPVCDPPCPNCLPFLAHPLDPPDTVVVDEELTQPYLRMAFPAQIRAIEQEAVRRALAGNISTSPQPVATVLPTPPTPILAVLPVPNPIEDVAPTPQHFSPAPPAPTIRLALADRIASSAGGPSSPSSSSSSSMSTKPYARPRALTTRVAPADASFPPAPQTFLTNHHLGPPPGIPTPPIPRSIISLFEIRPSGTWTFKVDGISRDHTWLEDLPAEDPLALQIVAEEGSTLVHRYLAGRSSPSSPMIRVERSDPTAIKSFLWVLNSKGGAPPEVDASPTTSFSRLNLHQLDILVWLRHITPYRKGLPPSKVKSLQSNLKFIVYSIAVHPGLFEAYHSATLSIHEQNTIWTTPHDLLSNLFLERLPSDDFSIENMLGDARRWPPPQLYSAMKSVATALSYRGMYPVLWNTHVVPLAKNYFRGGRCNFSAAEGRKSRDPAPSPRDVGAPPFHTPKSPEPEDNGADDEPPQDVVDATLAADADDDADDRISLGSGYD